MKLKGVMKIDLTNKTTGEVQSVTEENIITEAVNDIFALNPFAVHFTAGHSYEGIEWYKDMLPICPNLIGGILLFSKPLKEDAAAIYPTGDNLPVAYASNDVNSGSFRLHRATGPLRRRLSHPGGAGPMPSAAQSRRLRPSKR